MTFDYRAVEVYTNVLDKEYCESLYSTVMELKDEWTYSSKNNNQVRWNIGISALLGNCLVGGMKRERDGSGGYKMGDFSSMVEHKALFLETIQKLVPANFVYMDKHFPKLNKVIEQKYSEILGKPCEFHPNGTYYGFTIQHGWIGEDPGMAWHYDDIPRFYITGLIDHKTIIDQYSFTLGVSVPEYTSFEWYEKTLSEYPNDIWSPAERPCLEHNKAGYNGYCENSDCPFERGDYGDVSKIELQPGMLILQKGRFYHRPGPSVFKEGQSRVAIQCFGADVGDKIWLYK